MTQVDLSTQEHQLTRLEEPIHLYHQIQPHGVVLVLAEPDLNILQVSQNAQHILGISIAEILESNLEDIFDSFQLESIKAGLQNDDFDYLNPSKVWARVKGDEYAVFDAIFHRNTQGVLILELEPAISYENIPFLSFYHLAKTSINKLRRDSHT